MRLIDADALLADFKVRAINARNWKENAILNGNEEATIRADATIAFLTEVKLTIEKAPTIEPELIRKEMYRELERLKRMDVHGMQCEKDDYIFEYHEVSDRQGIVQFEKGVFVYHYSIAEPMSRQTFEEFCEEVVEKENNRGMDNKQSDKA